MVSRGNGGHFVKRAYPVENFERVVRVPPHLFPFPLVERAWLVEDGIADA